MSKQPNLSAYSTAELLAEVRSRRVYVLSCVCGKCKTCITRQRVQASRAKTKAAKR